MDSALRAANVFSSLTLVPHAVHAFRPDAQQKQDMLAFLNQKLTGCNRTGVNEKSELPRHFELSQNYPNPFWSGATSRSAGNPSTVISFQLPVNSHVTLKVFDVNGREVATLMDGELAAGKHAVTFAPSHSAGGLYFYKITAGKFSQTRKAILMK